MSEQRMNTSNEKREQKIANEHRTENSEQTSNKKIELTPNEEIEELKSFICDELFRLKRTQECMQACIGVMQGYELNLFEVYKLSEWLMNAANGIIEQNTKKVIEEK